MCQPRAVSVRIYCFTDTIAMVHTVCEYFQLRKFCVLRCLNVVNWYIHVPWKLCRWVQVVCSLILRPRLLTRGEPGSEAIQVVHIISWFSVGCVWSVVCSVVWFQCWWRRRKRLRDSCTDTRPSMKMQPGRWGLIPRLPRPQVFICCSRKLSCLAVWKAGSTRVCVCVTVNVTACKRTVGVMRIDMLHWSTVLLSVPAERLMQCSRPGTSKSTICAC